MKLAWTKTKPFALITEFRDGSSLMWPAGEWGRAKRVGENTMFDPINLYLSKLPNDKMETIEAVYRSVYEVFEGEFHELPIRSLIQYLTEQMEVLFSQVDWRHFNVTLLTANAVYLENGIKDRLDEKDRESITYLTKDYRELILFSVLVKLALPIWGIFYASLGSTIGKPAIGMRALNLIEVPSITHLQPWKKLVTHVENFAALHISESGNSILAEIGTEDIPEYLLSLTVSKKVAVHDATSTLSNLAADIYTTLFDRCGDINSHRPNDKIPNEGQSNEIGIADQYKPAQRISAAIIEMLHVYIEDYQRLARKIDPTIDQSLVERRIAEVRSRPELEIGDYHRSLCAAALHRVISSKTFSIIDYPHMITSIGVSSALLEHWGFPGLAQLMVMVPQDPNLHRIRVADSSARAFGDLPTAIFAELDAMYPYKAMGANPAIAVIDNIVSEIARYRWDIDDSEFDNIRVNLARLILEKVRQ